MVIDQKIYWALKDDGRGLAFFNLTEKQARLIFLLHIRRNRKQWAFRKPFDTNWLQFEGTKETIFTTRPVWFKE